MNSDEIISLNKYLANSGVSSRRKTAELIKRGEVLVNGQKATNPAQKINSEEDVIYVKGQKLEPSIHKAYIILNKPLDVVSTTSDELNRPTVTSIVKSRIKVYPVGRLDADSVGLVLLTNDGELTHKLTHPKYHIPKTYEVIVKGKVSELQLRELCSGVELKDGKTTPAEVRAIKEFPFTTKLDFKIHEGRNRQIRRMCGKVGLEVLELKRISLGPIKLEDLSSGEYRSLTPSEIEDLKKAVSK